MTAKTEAYNPKLQRVLEILPGALAWTVILFPLWGAFFIPRIVAYFTIAFLTYWFYRSFLSSILGIRGYTKIRRSEKINWYQKYQRDKTKDSFDWKKIKHVIVIPNHNESVEKLSSNLDCLVRQKGISCNQLAVILAMEGRFEGHRQKIDFLLKQYQGKFGHLIAAVHPANIPGEIIGKASNEAWAAKQAKKTLVDQKGWDINKMTLTSCDADACFHPKYFAALTYEFTLNPARYLRFWQSPIFWHNNFWRVPAFTKIVGTLGNIIHMASLQEPHGLFFNYSAYSASFKMIDDIGYWHTNIIPEDWHIFLQCFFAKRGKVEVEPIFLPTSIDAPEGKTYWSSLVNRYEQCKRHAWGASDIPYAINEAIRHIEIPFWTRFLRVYKLIETHLIWSTNWFILTLGAWLPALVNPVFKQTALGYNLPKISQIVLTVCLLFLAIIIALDAALRPKKLREKIPWWRFVLDQLQWVTMPIATLLMAVLPGLDAQTRLLLGKRLEYRVTEKV